MSRAHELGASAIGWLLNMSTPARTKVQVVQTPVSKRVLVFDLGHALAARDRVPSTAPWQLLDTPTVHRLAHETWHGDVLALRDAIDERRNAGLPTAKFLIAGRGALLGWSVTWEEARRTAHHELCTDLEVTIEVLARRVGDLLLLARPPQLAWERLLGAPFAVDDERFAAVSATPIAPVTEPAPASDVLACLPTSSP